MTQLIWDASGERLFETGVKNGVLYPQSGDGSYPLGVAWNGLTGITESPSGAEPTPIYADDAKYLNLISAEEFGATIEAYTYPDEFAVLDGSASLADGIIVGQQARGAFGLCYRTAIGNDIDGNDHGYKLHIIYGAIASPSERAYATINDSPEAITFSWELSTTPVAVTDLKPTSLLIVDSLKADAAALATLEDMLYGTAGSDPYLPLPDVIAALFASSPAALAMSSIVPNDGASSVAVDTTIVITWNNKIADANVVVTDDIGGIVSGTQVWDATGKILTITPSSNLDAATTYLVTMSGVVDIYAQTLADAVTDFTTA